MTRAETKRTYRILHMLPDLKLGGGQQVVLRNIANMKGGRFLHYVCYLLPFRDMEPRFLKQGIRLLFLHHRAWWSWPWVLSRLVRFVKEQRIDLVHVQGTPVDKFYGQAAAFLCKRPAVRTLHGMKPEARRLRDVLERPRPRTLVRWLRDKQERVIDGFLEPLTLQHVIAVSDAVLASWSGHLHKRRLCNGRITVNYNAVPVEQFAAPGDGQALERLRHEVGVGGAYPVLINVGRLSRPKGQAMLIPAMSSIVRQWPDAKLLLVGDGDARLTLAQEAAAAGLAEAVIFLGRRDDVPALLAISDVFVFCSFFEGLPLVLLEAMAACRPVVSVELPGLADIVQEGISGHLIKGRDADALARAVLDIVNDRERARAMGRRGRRLVSERFEMGASARELERVYESVLSTERR